MRKLKSLALLLVLGTAGILGVLPGSEASAQATGAFYTNNSRIYDPYGQEFIPVGSNLLGPNDMDPIQANRQFGNYDFTGTQGEIDALGMSDEVQAWNWNTVRLNICQSKYCLDKEKRAYTDPDFVARMDAIVEEYTSKRIVVIPELHELTGGAITQDMLDAALDFWLWAASRYQDNSYVWFNLLNEPNFNDYTEWSDFHEDAIEQIRATGSNNLIVIDSLWAGQDRNWETWITGTDLCTQLPTNESTFLGYSDDVRQGNSNIVFSLHVYEMWGLSGCTAQQHQDRLTEYVNGVRSLGVPLIVGESGHKLTEDNPDRNAAAAALYTVAVDLRLGILNYTSQSAAVPPNGDAFSLVQVGNFYEVGAGQSNLSAFGQLHWDYSQVLGAQISVPAGGGTDDLESDADELEETGLGSYVAIPVALSILGLAIIFSLKRHVYTYGRGSRMRL